MNELCVWIMDVLSWVILAYFLLLNGMYLFTTVVAFRALRSYVRRLKSFDLAEMVGGAGVPPITLVAPAYNEEATCVEATRALLTLNYGSYELLMINDGSKDATLVRMIDAYRLQPASRAPTASIPTAHVRGIYQSATYRNLWVIDKENGGKADALNTGLNYCKSPLFCAMDADTLLERDALMRLVRPFMDDGSTIAAGGIIRIANNCVIRSGAVEEVRLPKNVLARIQVLEYLRAFLSGRMGWDALNCMLIISGAFGIFKRSLVVTCGGYSTVTVGEDMELVVRLHRHCIERGIPYRVAFVPDPVAWTECPESLRVLGRQRDRWQRGLAQTLWRHRNMLLNPRYGRVGLLAFPYFFFLEMLGPLIEMPGYAAFAVLFACGQVSASYSIAFFMLAVVFGLSLSLAAVGMEELTFRRYPRFSDLLRLFGIAVLENFGYRQLTTWWRVRGMVSFLRGSTSWGAMERKGFTAATPRK